MLSKTTWKRIGLGIIALLILIVIFQNTESVSTSILFVEFSMPRVALLFITLIIGIVLGVLGDRYLLKR